jgi:hypothetical protein
MRTTKKERTKLPKHLYQVRKRFAQWRQTHPPRARFSESLWSEAVTVAREYGHSLTARVLRLDYYSLKNRLTAPPTINTGKTRPNSFVEFIPSTTPSSECIIEMEDDDGGKMRITLKGGDIPDLALLSSSFWRKEA